MTSEQVLTKINSELQGPLLKELIDIECQAMNKDNYSFFQIFYNPSNDNFHTLVINGNSNDLTPNQLIHLLTIDRRAEIFTTKEFSKEELKAVVIDDLQLIKRRLHVKAYLERR